MVFSLFGNISDENLPDADYNPAIRY
jgi:hypothetical protein